MVYNTSKKIFLGSNHLLTITMATMMLSFQKAKIDNNSMKVFFVQSKLFITSLIITEYSISDIKLLGTDLFPLKFPLYNRIFT